MKKYFTVRPAAQIAVQWGGANVAEFEDAALNYWNNQYLTFTFEVNGSGELDVKVNDSLWASVPVSYWYLQGNPPQADPIPAGHQELPADGPWSYEIADDDE